MEYVPAQKTFKTNKMIKYAGFISHPSNGSSKTARVRRGKLRFVSLANRRQNRVYTRASQQVLWPLHYE